MEEEQRKITAPDAVSVRFSARRSIWLNVVLFVLTVFSTFFVGIELSLSYKYAEVLIQNPQKAIDFEVLSDPEVIVLGAVYATVLLAILLGHELGHFLTCRYYRLNATLPYFIPAPTLVGTLGAFIKIKSPITRKHQLFDIGVAGPLTGFILSLPALVYGFSLSKVVPSVSLKGGIIFGESVLLRLIGVLIFKDIPEGHDVYLHPIAFAGWVGILVTSLNLFPVGQLDGGHVSYALLGSKSRNLARLFLAVFFVMGVFFWIGWFIWGFIILFLGLKHPRVLDEAIPLSSGRKIIGFIIILIFILSFIPDPVKGYNLFDLLRGLRF